MIPWQLWQWEPCSQVSARIPWRNLGSEPTAHRLGHKSTFCSGSPEMDAPFMSVPLFMVSVIQGAFVNTCRCNNCCSIIDFLSSVVGYSAPDGIAQKKTNSLQSEHPAFVVLWIALQGCVPTQQSCCGHLGHNGSGCVDRGGSWSSSSIELEGHFAPCGDVGLGSKIG